MPPSPLLYHHLSKKKNNNNNILHAICVTDLGATQNPEFPWTKPKAICGWGTFLSIFGSGQVRNLISGRGVFYQVLDISFQEFQGSLNLHLDEKYASHSQTEQVE